MKNTLKAFAIAATLALPAVSSAQAFDPDVSLQITSQHLPTPGTGFESFGNGGGFKANFTLKFPTQAIPATFDDYLVWCIDVTRTVDVPGTYEYQAWTAEAFANSTLGSGKPNNLSIEEMRAVVSMVSILQTSWNVFDADERADYQGGIWAAFRGELGSIPVGVTYDANASLDDWVVLYNGENQTFLTYVPEPSETALLLVGIAGVAFMVMKRRRLV
jgi:hypothetical protein